MIPVFSERFVLWYKPPTVSVYVLYFSQIPPDAPAIKMRQLLFIFRLFFNSHWAFEAFSATFAARNSPDADATQANPNVPPVKSRYVNT